MFSRRRSAHLAQLDRLCVAGCAGFASPPYPTGFSPALETETCFWCSVFLSAYAVGGFPAVLVLSSLGRRWRSTSGRHFWPGPRGLAGVWGCQPGAGRRRRWIRHGGSWTLLLSQHCVAMLAARHVTWPPGAYTDVYMSSIDLGEVEMNGARMLVGSLVKGGMRWQKIHYTETYSFKISIFDGA